MWQTQMEHLAVAFSLTQAWWLWPFRERTSSESSDNSISPLSILGRGKALLRQKSRSHSTQLCHVRSETEYMGRCYLQRSHWHSVRLKIWYLHLQDAGSLKGHLNEIHEDEFKCMTHLKQEGGETADLNGHPSSSKPSPAHSDPALATC